MSKSYKIYRAYLCVHQLVETKNVHIVVPDPGYLIKDGAESWTLKLSVQTNNLNSFGDSEFLHKMYWESQTGYVWAVNFNFMKQLQLYYNSKCEIEMAKIQATQFHW